MMARIFAPFKSSTLSKHSFAGDGANYRWTEPKYRLFHSSLPLPNVSSTSGMRAMNQFDREMLQLSWVESPRLKP
jgi:hypothetical protein